ncbi:uncharacterized protein LOC141605424 isoform X2 [Silene latifolia]|uniref:uncharacterized protein LOC141605424 isoform X2 n=1 Tax=Silene latifolia TaxID=37657 RepID=UPI003D779CBF
MAEGAKVYGYLFPYLYDEMQFASGRKSPFELVYHGQFDDSRPSNNVPITWSVGCRIKWHPEVFRFFWNLFIACYEDFRLLYHGQAGSE